MREQVRFRVILPLAVVAVLGLGVSKFAFSEPLPEPESVPVRQQAAAPPAEQPAAKPKAEKKAEKPKKKAAAKKKDQKAKAGKKAAKPSVEKRLSKLLRRHGAAVLVFYTPDSTLDALATREARAGAKAVGAGFLAVDATDEKAVSKLATTYDVRDTPTVLVIGAAPREVVTRLDGWGDSETIAQAAENALT